MRLHTELPQERVLQLYKNVSRGIFPGECDVFIMFVLLQGHGVCVCVWGGGGGYFAERFKMT